MSDRADATLASGEGPPLDPVDVARTRAAIRRELFGVEVPPTQIGRFVVLSPLGAGAMGRVHLAYDPTLDRKVALKLIAPDKADDDASRDRLLREAQSMARLSHPNAVAVYEVGTAGDDVFFAMEFVPGTTLRTWIKRPHSRREVIATLLQAGRGLAAAHARGIIHRDFKPDNVLVGDDRRVRVSDFGLAQPERQQSEVSEGSSESATTVDLGPRGSALGTPGYIAPEQRGGVPPSVASDQFSFCVTLWEALHGARPRPGTPQRPPKSAVPGWLYRILERGLQVDPNLRYPSMQVLLADLGRDVTRRNRRLAVGALALGLAAAGIAAGRTSVGGDTVACDQGRQQLGSAWNESRRQVAEDALLATGVPHAEATWRSTARRLDEYGNAWVAAYDDACAATHIRGEQSPQLLDAKMACLDQRRTDLGALVDALGRATKKTVDVAAQAPLGLPAIAQCNDARMLQSDGLDTDDPVAKEIRVTIAQARAQRLTGDFVAGLALCDDAAKRAEDSGLRAVHAEALEQRGGMHKRLGKYEPARDSLQTAFWLAMEIGHDATMTDAATALITVVGVNLADAPAGLLWGRHAEAAAKRAGADVTRQAQIPEAMATVKRNNGDYEAAIADHEAVLALREQALGPDHIHVGFTLVNLAAAQIGNRDPNGVASAKRAAQILEAELGPDHPHVGTALNTLATAQAFAGNNEQARTLLERTLAIRERALGPNHPFVGATLGTLGTIWIFLGQPDKALAAHERQLAIVSETLPDGHPSRGFAHFNLGVSLTHANRLDEAHEHLQRALDLWSATWGPDHTQVAAATGNLGQLALRRDEHAKAEVLYGRAVEIWTKAHGADHPRTAEGLSGLGQAKLGLGRVDEATAILHRAERALSVDGGEPRKLAAVTFALGRAAWADGDHDRARALVERARAMFDDGSIVHPHLQAEIATWLREH